MLNVNALSAKMKLVIIVLISVIAIGGLLAFNHYNSTSRINNSPNASRVVVTAVDLKVGGVSISSLSGFTNKSGAIIYYTFLYPRSSSQTSISLLTTDTPGFSVLSVSPTPPQIISAGGNETFTIEFGLPNTAYIGTLDILLSLQSNASSAGSGSKTTGFGNFSVLSYSCSVYRGFSVVLLNNKGFSIAPEGNPTILSSNGLSPNTALKFSTNSLVLNGNTFSIENSTQNPCGATTGASYDLNLSFSYLESNINYTLNSTVRGTTVG